LGVGDAFVDSGLLELELETGKLGRIVWLSDLLGAPSRSQARPVLLLNFFAIWCAPCFTELALLERWRQTYGEQGLQVVSVNVRLPDEDADESARKTVALLAGQKLGFPLLFDRHTQRTQLIYLGSEATLPSNLLIAGDGKVLFRTQGARADELAALEQQLRAALGLTPPPAAPPTAATPEEVR
jgi:thiol-disulfide isomerase/thioredoxin